jgi:hypothetical protein
MPDCGHCPYPGNEDCNLEGRCLNPHLAAPVTLNEDHLRAFGFRTWDANEELLGSERLRQIRERQLNEQPKPKWGDSPWDIWLQNILIVLLVLLVMGLAGAADANMPT